MNTHLALREAREHLHKLEDTRESILLKSATEGRSLTPAEAKDLEGLAAKIRKAADRVGEIEDSISLGETIKRRAVPVEPQGRVFNSFGEQLAAVIRAGTPGGQVDPKLYELAPSGMGETVPSDGGFLVESAFASEIFRRAYDTGAVAKLCRRMPIGPGRNGIKLPYVDETSRATGSRWGGIQVYRAAEADTVTAKKPKIARLEVELQKLMGLCYLTEELMQDATALEQFVTDGFNEEIGFTLDDELIAGNGIARCLGILNSAAKISVSKESGQAAATIEYENIVNMWSRLWAGGRRNSVWFINQDIEPQLMTLVQVIGTGGVPVYLPPGGASAEPYGRIFGRPVIPIEQCKTLGTEGDIILADMSQYLLIDKPPKTDTSMHVRFVYDEMAFRFVYRVNGQPLWKSALTPANGTNTVSPFITLETRA